MLGGCQEPALDWGGDRKVSALRLLVVCSGTEEF